MKNWLENEYVILSGASGGIGKELCKLLLSKYSAKVIGIGRNEEKMKSFIGELGELAQNFSYRLFDVGVKESWIEFCFWLEENGIRPVLLINNAGVFPTFKKTLRTPHQTMEQIMQTNYFSVVYATEFVAPLLKDNGKFKAGIVNVSSSAALCAVIGTSAYSASKAAVKNYTEALQMEEQGKKYIGIIYPGTTATDLFNNDENTKNSILQKIAMCPQKMAKKIAKKIYRRKNRAVLGWDAKIMNFAAKLGPVKGLRFIRFVMKSSRSKVFSEVFDRVENKEE